MKTGKLLKYIIFAIAAVMLAITVAYAVINGVSPLELPFGIIMPLVVVMIVAIFVAVGKGGSK